MARGRGPGRGPAACQLRAHSATRGCAGRSLPGSPRACREARRHCLRGCAGAMPAGAGLRHRPQPRGTAPRCCCSSPLRLAGVEGAGAAGAAGAVDAEGCGGGRAAPPPARHQPASGWVMKLPPVCGLPASTQMDGRSAPCQGGRRAHGAAAAFAAPCWRSPRDHWRGWRVPYHPRPACAA